MYLPQSYDVYLTAFAGALAGLGASGRYLTSPKKSDYDLPSRSADAFAQAVDIAWAGAPLSELDLLSLQEVCEGVWAGRSPLITSLATSKDNYFGIAQAIIALVQAGTDQVVSQGIAPGAPKQLNVNAALSATVTISFAGVTPAFSIVEDIDRSVGCTLVGIVQPVNLNQVMLVDWTLDTPIPPDDRITIASFNLSQIQDLDPVLPIPPIVIDAVADTAFRAGVALNGSSQMQGSPDLVFDLHILLLTKVGVL